MENHHFQWVNPLFLWPFSMGSPSIFSNEMDWMFAPAAQADWYDMPHDVLARISNRIINEAGADAALGKLSDAKGSKKCWWILMADGKKKATLALIILLLHTSTMAAMWFQLWFFKFQPYLFGLIIFFSPQRALKPPIRFDLCHPDMGMNG